MLSASGSGPYEAYSREGRDESEALHYCFNG
jgi:hypothetical protein